METLLPWGNYYLHLHALAKKHPDRDHNHMSYFVSLVIIAIIVFFFKGCGKEDLFSEFYSIKSISSPDLLTGFKDVKKEDLLHPVIIALLALLATLIITT